MLRGKHERTRFDEGFGFVFGFWFHIKDGVNYSIPITALLLPLFFVLSLESKGYVNQAF